MGNLEGSMLCEDSTRVERGWRAMGGKRWRREERIKRGERRGRKAEINM